MLAQVIGEHVPTYVIGVEKREPFRCGVWRLSDDTMRLARQQVEAAIRRLIDCRETDEWPTGFEQVRILDIA